MPEDKKCVLFDVGRVILKNLPDEHNIIASATGLSSEKVAQIMSTLKAPYQRGDFSDEQFWQEFKKHTQFNRLPMGYDKLWSDSFARDTKIDTEIIEIASKLRATGHKTGILSNTIPPHVKINRARGTYNGFDPVILSCEVNARKPEQKIFKIAVREAQMQKSDIVFIDDDQSFVNAAKEFGIDAILHSNPQQLEQELRKRVQF